MRATLVGFVEPVSVLFYGALVSILTVVSLGAELLGLADLLLGGTLETTALWLVYLGAIGLAAAIVVARRRLLPLLSRRADSASN